MEKRTSKVITAAIVMIALNVGFVLGKYLTTKKVSSEIAKLEQDVERLFNENNGLTANVSDLLNSNSECGSMASQATAALSECTDLGHALLKTIDELQDQLKQKSNPPQPKKTEVKSKGRC